MGLCGVGVGGSRDQRHTWGFRAGEVQQLLRPLCVLRQAYLAHMTSLSICMLWDVVCYTSRRTNLDHVDTNVVNAGIDLFHDKILGNMVDSRDPLCILRSQGCRCSHGVAAMSSYNFLVGL